MIDYFMGKTRDFLYSIETQLDLHSIAKKELLDKYRANPDREKHYRHQIEALEQKYEDKLRSMIEKHITYLEEKDPYGRAPLYGATAKKELLVQIQQDLKNEHGLLFLQKLSRAVAKLQTNPIIDEPRWAKLQLNNVFHFFKSVLSNRTAYSENITQKHSSKPPKH